jgi:hypothetical protein
MPIIGVVQRFDTYLQELRTRYGWEPAPYPVMNQTANRIREITATEERIIMQHNVFDMMLYQYAERQHEQNL